MVNEDNHCNTMLLDSLHYKKQLHPFEHFNTTAEVLCMSTVGGVAYWLVAFVA